MGFFTGESVSDVVTVASSGTKIKKKKIGSAKKRQERSVKKLTKVNEVSQGNEDSRPK